MHAGPVLCTAARDPPPHGQDDPMDETTYQAIAMIVYFVGMLAIGGWAYGRNNDLDDYMLADRGLNPWVAALSAGASDMSG